VPWSSEDVIRALLDDGWQQKRVRGSHHHFRHPSKPGTVTVPHPRRELPRGTLAAVGRAAGLAFGRNP
jgi:predicted RNA binding protein YcfA (HicA-like mRNA interferase family)